MGKILCVAEKPSIAKAVANHLSGGHIQTRNTQNKYIKNYEFSYRFNNCWGDSAVVFTSVIGHLLAQDFDERHRKWNSCPPGQLFDAPIVIKPDDDKKDIAKNIEVQARFAKVLYIWTDCDREGEHIGTEIRDIALKANPRLEVKRARFNNIERAHIIHAASTPINIDEKQANAVQARIELDLRLGAAFTRLQTLSLGPMIERLDDVKAVSYGSCQFPTLGFVVDRYFRVQNFKPEPFWNIKVMHKKDNVQVNFNWRRVHLFDRMIVTILFERCLMARTARVTKMQKRPTSKWRPLPLTTVELQKMGSRFLRMDSQRVMTIAEALYTKGWISYPRTETDQFDRGMNLRGLIEKQHQDGRWGQFAQGALNQEEQRVYEFVVRRFLACCSTDAVGELTTVEILYGPETFSTSGLIVLQRNYLDVYVYDKWTSSQQLPQFTEGEQFVPTEAKMTEGKTAAPGYLTEPELIALMDANGIGTDATMAEHIAKIKERRYVDARPKSGGGSNDDGGGEDADDDTPAARGGGRGRGRGRGRGGGGGGGNSRPGGGTNGVQEFIPTTLGVALIEGYEQIGFDMSLAKPFLRKEMELQMKAICAGTTNRNDVVHQNIEQYRDVFIKTERRMDVLKTAVRKYVLGQQG